MPPSLAVAIAETIRTQRYEQSTGALPPRSLGKNWLDKFRKRHPEIQGVWTRKIDNARFKAIRKEIVQAWFDAVTDLIVTN